MEMEKIEDGWYLLCPECGKLSKGGDWEEKYTNYMRGRVHLIEAEEGVFLDYTDEEIEDTERRLAKHICGFTTESWNPEEFVVKIKDGKVVDLGEYWYDTSLQELEEVLRKNNLKLDKEKVLKVVE